MRTFTGCGREMTPRRLYLIGFAVVLEALPVWLRAHRLGGHVVVRCRQGHHFTTLWIPGISVKSLRLGFWRVERCPVGHHWSVVTPVRLADLSNEERHMARAQHDVWIP
jgi:hypothetical protein